MRRKDPYTEDTLDLSPREFRRFVTEKPLLGLGQDFYEMRERFCKPPELIDLWDRATVGKPGSVVASNNPQGTNQYTVKSTVEPIEVNRNIITVNQADPSEPPPEPDRGTSRQYAIRKLRNDAPEIHARVLAGELSPHAGMIEAGFRIPVIQVPADPVRAARLLAKHFTRDQFAEVVAYAYAEYERRGEV